MTWDVEANKETDLLDDLGVSPLEEEIISEFVTLGPKPTPEVQTQTELIQPMVRQ